MLKEICKSQGEKVSILVSAMVAERFEASLMRVKPRAMGYRRDPNID
jgi:hypothetical protein